MKLVVFAHTPPPHHGQSFMVEQLLKQLREQTPSSSASPDLQVFHVNARLSDEIEQIGHPHVWKLFRALRYVLQAVWLRFREGVTAMLYVPAPGLRVALYRDWLVVGLCRCFFPNLIYYWQAAGLADWLQTQAAPWERRISNRLLRSPALSIVLSEYNRADAEWALSRRIAVIPNGVADPCPDYAVRLEPIRKLRADTIRKAMRGEMPTNAPPTFRALFIGLCCREKGLFDAMEAMVLLNRSLAAKGLPLRARLSVAGTFFSKSDREEFDARLSLPEFAEAVDYRGFVAGEAKRQLFEEHDCMVFPTYYLAENSPLVLIEGMACGMSIVATRWRSIPELFPPEFPCLVEPMDPQAVATALETVMRSESNSTLRRRFLDKYTVERHAAEVKRAILNAGAGARRRHLAKVAAEPRLALTYSLADQDFARTKSIGIYNVSVQLARSLAIEPRLAEMTVLANPTMLDDLSLRRVEKVEIRDCVARTPWQRILWDQWNVYSEAKRAGNEWLLLPKGFASFVRRPPARLAAYV
ncbi:MAG TPA: glycosyltransferase family 4 protein, partial [Methylomirabilota bacterium]|nr:glycosyltransferase family 4 protein [Methylomirabilota bacterium]